jgi:hypothetical protein
VNSGSLRSATPTFTLDGNELSFAGADSECIGFLVNGRAVIKDTYVP